jgi:ADP-L-glycero-D-manno-heptose 6-epimerase
MIAITGAGGFIGSVVLGYLNQQGIDDILIFDDLPHADQYKNLIGKKYKSIHSTAELISNVTNLECVIHLGANSNTLEKSWNDLYKNNVLTTRRWHDLCKLADKKFIWASSASVTGNGSGPLNQYAFSKLTSEKEITNGIALRLFNVYGPNEYHKDRMASTAYHWYNQLAETSELQLFENSENYYRDFVYVEDVAKVIYFFLKNYKPGIYDVGSGVSTSFNTLADQLIASAGRGKKTEIAMPTDLSSQYQANTMANLTALSSAGYDIKSLKDTQQGLKCYCDYLKDHSYY